MKYLFVSNGLPGPKNVISLMMVHAKPMQKQYRVVLLCLELSVSNVAHFEIGDHATMFQLQLTKRGKLVWRLVRPMSENKWRLSQEKRSIRRTFW